METALKLEHVYKRMGKREILHDINLETYAGEVFGFLGPNGAGKTTTIKMAVGLLSTDAVSYTHLPFLALQPVVHGGFPRDESGETPAGQEWPAPAWVS